MKKIRKLISIFLMTFIVANVVFASPYDLEGHWAKNTIEELMTKSIISGYSDGSIKPDNFIKRAEFMITVNKLFEFNTTSNIKFNDINGTEWYANDVSKAYKAGYISGYSDNTIKAENFITRQEAAIIIQKILSLPDDTSGINKFNDADKIDNWSRGAIGAVANANIINGYTDGTFGAKRNITRAEAFTMISKAYKYKNSDSNAIIVSSYDEFKTVINNAVENLEPSITLKIKDFDENVYDLKKLGLNNITIKAEGSIKGTTATLKCVFEYTQNFKLSLVSRNSNLISKLNEDDILIFNKLKNINSSIVNEGMIDYQKEKAIHDYIVINYQYDTKNTSDANAVKYLLQNKSGNCEAYSNTFNILANLAGLDCSIVTGAMDDVGHAWNIIKLDGEYYHVDVTSDDPIPDEEGRILYNFFNLSDSELSRTHIWDKNNATVCSGQKYNYFVYNQLVVTSLEQMKAFISEKIKSKYDEITIYTKGFIINGIDDFKFIQNYENVNSIKVTGNYGKEGAFVINFAYR